VISRVIDTAKRFMATELELDATVVAVEKMGEGWMATAEAIMVDPDMRRLAKRDLVTTFELRLNAEFEVLSYERKAMRERGSIIL
jgi:hypothetical protein